MSFMSSLPNLTAELLRTPGPSPASCTRAAADPSPCLLSTRLAQSWEPLPTGVRQCVEPWLIPLGVTALLRGDREPLELIGFFCGRGTRVFAMSWDAHTVMAVPPGISLTLLGRDTVACIAAFLPLSQELLASLFPHTLVTLNYAGRITLEWGGRAGTGAGDPAVPVAPNLGWRMEKSLARSAGRQGLVGRALISSPSLEGRKMLF